VCRELDIKVEELLNISKLEDDWQTMIETLDALKFADIKLDMTIFPHLTNDQMCHIYESINEGGVKLSKQELLASSTSRMHFTKETLSSFDELKHLIETKYYEDMNRTEKLKIVEDSKDVINLFEVLVAFQYKLHAHYSYFIPEPCASDKGTDLDILFKLYTYLMNPKFYEKSDKTFDTAPSVDLLNQVLKDIELSCQWIDRIYKKYYNININCKEIKKYLKISKNVVILLIVYIVDAMRLTIEKGIIDSNLCHVIIYNELITEYPASKRSEIQHELKIPNNSLRYEEGGTFIPNQVRKIKDIHLFESIPTIDHIRILLERIFQDELEETNTCAKRTSLTKVKVIALSVFYGAQIPSIKMSEPHNKDHIIPISITWTGLLDINRLGNLQLISETLNKSRGAKPITDAWIEEKGLIYQFYPKEAEYAGICDHKMIKDLAAYNAMCERREKKYKDLILATL
jgi:hypothetical protein